MAFIGKTVRRYHPGYDFYGIDFFKKTNGTSVFRIVGWRVILSKNFTEGDSVILDGLMFFCGQDILLNFWLRRVGRSPDPGLMTGPLGGQTIMATVRDTPMRKSNHTIGNCNGGGRQTKPPRTRRFLAKTA